MKTRNSEYKTSYQKIPTEYCNELHEQMVKYRNLRREREFAHEKIKWDSSDSSGCSTPSQNENEEHIAFGKEHDDVVMHENEIGKENQDQADEDTIAEPEAVTEIHQETDHRKKRARSNVEVETEDKPPFVTYGWADKEIETARKRTHNVKANKVYVYPAALKKLKLVKEKQMRQKDDRAESRASVAAALKIKQKVQNSDIWMTEYQRCYSQASVSRPGSAYTSRSTTQQTARRRPHTAGGCNRRTPNR
uniref:centriole, cilia and spindle-associated protein-like n=1 Tax=Styela clava TaxID=7725 RepID=UPI00193A0BD0|nr:centriole, cilia and spindle-associated protein-like [Styela clava]